MKPQASSFFVLMILGYGRERCRATKKVPHELWRKVQERGTGRVMVELDVAVDPHKKLTPAKELAQRNAIAAAQKEVIASLIGTKHKIYMQDDRIRGLAMAWTRLVCWKSLRVSPESMKIIFFPRRGS